MRAILIAFLSIPALIFAQDLEDLTPYQRVEHFLASNQVNYDPEDIMNFGDGGFFVTEALKVVEEEENIPSATFRNNDDDGESSQDIKGTRTSILIWNEYRFTADGVYTSRKTRITDIDCDILGSETCSAIERLQDELEVLNGDRRLGTFDLVSTDTDTYFLVLYQERWQKFSLDGKLMP